ncbi:radical SAM protein [Candidatus Bathyarchaeota archaeon]|nr:radical SAM protein [Candidatus Bathyarchaeota archaeon]
MTTRESDLVDALRSMSPRKAWDCLMEMDIDAFVKLQTSLRMETNRHFGMKIASFIPGDSFPSISLTGTACELQCLHCNRKYLKGMIPATSPEDLRKVLHDIHLSGGKGALISGGSTREGIVKMEPFYPVIREIKANTKLLLNVHAGLISKKEAEKLLETGIDTISMDFVGDNETIKEIYGMDKSVDDYKKTLTDLILAGFTTARIIPHVCIGLNHGRLSSEHLVLDYLTALDPRLLVFIILIPPRARDDFALIDPVEVGKVIAIARLFFPRSELALGCMRPGGKYKQVYDHQAFRSGITRIALPSGSLKKTLLKRGYEITRHETCCAMEPSLRDKLK